MLFEFVVHYFVGQTASCEANPSQRVKSLEAENLDLSKKLEAMQGSVRVGKGRGHPRRPYSAPVSRPQWCMVGRGGTLMHGHVSNYVGNCG